MDPIAIGNFLMYTGALGALLLFVIGQVRKWWRMENSHTEIVAEMKARMAEKDVIIAEVKVERDDWKNAYLRAVNQGDQALDLAHKVKS